MIGIARNSPTSFEDVRNTFRLTQRHFHAHRVGVLDALVAGRIEHELKPPL
jgi:hypothetical protein